MNAFTADLKHAWRKLFKGSGAGATLVAIASIGLGVGVSAAIFGAVDQVLLTALPYPEPERVVVIEDRTDEGPPLAITYGTFIEVARRNRSFESLAVADRWQPVLVAAGEPTRLAGDRVSPDYFRVLGVRPSIGRDFAAADDVDGAPRVAIVSAGFAQRRFGSAAGVLEHTITLDQLQYTVIGVMPDTFENALSPSAEVWAPLRFRADAPFESAEWGHRLRMVGRLLPGVPLAQAQREMTTLAASPAAEFPRPQWALLDNGLFVERLLASVTSEVRPALLAVLGAVLLLLAITCANVTNILLARALARRAELATRAVLGARRGRLMQQLFAESALLALVGGVLGIGIAALASRAFVALAPATLPRLDAIGFDGRVFAFAIATTALVALVVALVPAWRAGDNVAEARLQSGMRATTPGLVLLRRGLVVAQIALATVLLASAGLLLRSVDRVFAVPAGFDPSGVVTMRVIAAGTGIRSSAEAHALFSQVLESVHAVPGVVEAALTNQLPLSGDNEPYAVVAESSVANPAGAPAAFRYTVTPGWFETMGVPLKRGRTLGAEDVSDAPQAIVISESLAARRFAGRDPIGERVRMGPYVNRPELPWGTIVGIVGDVKQTSLGSTSSDAFYVAMGQWLWVDDSQALVVRTAADPAAFVEPIKQAIWSVNPSLPVMQVTTMADLVDESEARRTFALAVFAAFGLAALLLAGVGVYGVIEGRVTERTREIGLRAALGATPAKLAAFVVSQGLTLAAIGIVVGIAAAAGATQGVASLLFGVERFDPVTYAGVVALLLGVVFIACYAPAFRAARIDPAITLRAD